jgi:hypothetical protein
LKTWGRRSGIDAARSDVEAANDGSWKSMRPVLRNRRAATWRGIASVYARVERKTTKERRTLTVQHRGRSCDDDNADGNVRSTSRKDELKSQSTHLYAALPISSAKTQRRRRRPRSESTNRASSEQGRRRARQTAKEQDGHYLLLRPDVRRSSRSGERWWQDGASADANLKTRPADVS